MKFVDHCKEGTEREQKPRVLGDSKEIDCLDMEKLGVMMGMMSTHCMNSQGVYKNVLFDKRITVF